MEHATPADSTPTVAGPPVIMKVAIAEITCLLCARTMGTATSECWPPRGLVWFQAAGSRTVCRIAAWWRLGCPDCGGNSAVSDLVVRTVRLAPPVDWRGERPRRGRPPAWLVAQRRAANLPDE